MVASQKVLVNAHMHAYLMLGSKTQNVPARRRKRGAGRRVSQVIRADESGVELATAL